MKLVLTGDRVCLCGLHSGWSKEVAAAGGWRLLLLQDLGKPELGLLRFRALSVLGSTLCSTPGSQQPGFRQILFLRQNAENLPWLIILLRFQMHLNPRRGGRYCRFYSLNSTSGLLSAEMNQTIRGAKGFNSRFLFWFNPYTNHPAIAVQFIVRRFMWQMSFPPGHVCSSFCLQSHAFGLAMLFVSNFINTVRCLPVSDCATWLLTKGKLLQRRLKHILGTAWSSRG